MKRDWARRRYLRKHHPFPRFSFDAAWRAAVDALVNPYWERYGRGAFELGADGYGEATLPDGRVYRGRLRRYLRRGQRCYIGFLACQDRKGALLDEALNADGAVPEPRPPSFNLWPLQLKLSPAPPLKSGQAGADYMGLMWLPAADGRPGGQLYSVFGNRCSFEIPLKGYVSLYRSAKS